MSHPTAKEILEDLRLVWDMLLDVKEKIRRRGEAEPCYGEPPGYTQLYEAEKDIQEAIKEIKIAAWDEEHPEEES